MELYERKCPCCDKIITYQSKYNKNSAEKNHKICRTCSSKKRYKTFGSYIDIINKEVKNGTRLNGFINKKHKKETIQKLIDIQNNRDNQKYKSIEFKNKISKATKGKNNPMYGKKFYNIWCLKYGKDVADKKLKEFKEKISKNNKGNKNPMYGKNTPVGSGNGWSGWYKKWFFRSLHELSYMIKIIERFNLEWESAEKNEFRINYIGYSNQKRTHVCDFVISKKYLVEIKPKKLHNTVENKIKSDAAIDFCKKNNLIYKKTYCNKLTNEEFTSLIDSNEVILTNRYKIKYNEYIKKNK